MVTEVILFLIHINKDLCYNINGDVNGRYAGNA